MFIYSDSDILLSIMKLHICLGGYHRTKLKYRAADLYICHLIKQNMKKHKKQTVLLN